MLGSFQFLMPPVSRAHAVRLLSWSCLLSPGTLYMNAMPPAVMGMKLNGKLGGVVSVFPTYPMSLTA